MGYTHLLFVSKKIFITYIIVLLWTLFAHQVLAHHRWLDGTGDHIKLWGLEDVTIIYCSMSMDHKDAINRAAFTWNDPVGTYDQIELYVTYDSCSSIEIKRLDNWSTISGWSSNADFLDGGDGIINVDWVIATGQIESFDIGFDRELNVTEDELSANKTGQEVIIHEFGHALGMDEEDDEMTIMHPSLAAGKMGYRSHDGGGHTSVRSNSIWPDDMAYMMLYQESPNEGNIDPFTSA